MSRFFVFLSVLFLAAGTLSSPTNAAGLFNKKKGSAEKEKDIGELGLIGGLHINDFHSNTVQTFNSAPFPTAGLYGSFALIDELQAVFQVSYAQYNGDYQVVSLNQVLDVTVETAYLDFLIGLRAIPFKVPTVAPYIEAGVVMGVNMDEEIEITQQGGTRIPSTPNLIRNSNIALAGGIGIQVKTLPIPLYLGVRYQHGLTDLTRTPTEQWHTRAYQLYVAASLLTF
jgi:hypothetical protein